MADAAVSVAVEVAKCLVAPVGRHCGYVIFSDRYVRQLKDELAKLDEVRGGVQRSISGAENNMREIRPDVNRWKNEAENSANKANGVLNNEGRAKKTCFCGWLPNPKERYCRGRDARKTAQAIQAIQACIPQGTFEGVYLESAPPGLVGGAPNVNSSACDGGITMLKSQASTFQDVMKALYDEKHKVIGVYGPGGVGKTTLLEIVKEKLNKEGKERRLFHVIIKSTVSQTPDLTKIQYDIAYALNLKDVKAEPSDEGRRDLLFKRLQKDPSKKVLIILDDLWAELDLKAVGIPMGNESMKGKLLLTSRDKRVLEQRMNADQTFPLKGLEEEEALKLFESKVGDRLRDNEELKAKAAQVVTKLAGLPLLITSVASTLKRSNVSTWESMLIKIEDPNDERIVKWSYDYLEYEDAKYLFLLCGLIGGTIKVELLLGLGMGLGLFEGYNKRVQDSRNRLNEMLDSLQSFCLLQGGGYSADGKRHVTIHDLYSELVVSKAFGGENYLMMNRNYVPQSKEKKEKCWAICLADVDKDRLDKRMTYRFPSLKILMLSQQEGWRGRQEHDHEVGDCSRLPDFTNMEELCALYLHSMHITRLPPSIGILGNLHSLYLDHCNVEDVAILGKLEALQILSFEWSKISRLPEEIGKLTNLRLLNLNYCYSIKIIMPGALKGLINLEELHMKKSLDPQMGKHEESSELCVAGLIELKSLTKLAFMEISIPDPIIPLEDGDLPFENLDKFWINIGHAEVIHYEDLTTMNLNLRGCDSILSKKGFEKNLLKTQRLYLSNLSEFEESPSKLCTQGFREMKYLNINDSPSIKYIADSSNAYSSDGLPLIAFGKLEKILLHNLINLEKICHGPIALDCFNKLKVVNVGQCGKLKYLWCLSDVQRLKQLEEIAVAYCDSMQSIVTHDAGEDIVSTDNRVELPNVSLPQLESLIMIGLLSPEEILYSKCSLKYSNLRELSISESKSTSKSILKLDWILKLPNLKSLSLWSSPSTEEVFDLEELKVSRDDEILSRLTELILYKLPNLQHMWKWDVKLQGISILRNLREVNVNETGLSFLFSASMAKCLREIRVIKVMNCPNMKAVIVDEGRDEGIDDIIEFPLLEQLIIQCPMEKFFQYPHGKKEPITTTAYSQDANSNSFFDQKVTFPNITRLEISGLQSKELCNNQIPTNSFQKLESLQLSNCDNLQRIATSYMWKKLQLCLKELKVISCPLIKIIYEGDGAYTEIGELRTLVLCDLENLRSIWQSDSLPNIPFPNLRDVEAVRCPHLELVFPTFTAKFLGQIEELVVESCEDMELIAGHEKWEEATGTTITFSKLIALRLFELQKFKSFLPKKYSLKFPCSEHFPSLRVMSIVSCGAKPDQVLGDWYFHQWERELRWQFKT